MKNAPLRINSNQNLIKRFEISISCLARNQINPLNQQSLPIVTDITLSDCQSVPSTTGTLPSECTVLDLQQGL